LKAPGTFYVLGVHPFPSAFAVNGWLAALRATAGVALGGRNCRAIHIRRREFIFTLGVAAVAWPLAARAQQPKVPTIGALVIGNISPEEFWREFRQGLRDLGYIEGQNIRFEFRSAEGQINRLPELAAELVRLKVDVIVTWFTPTAVAAKQATREIPIVMADRRSRWYGAGREPSSTWRKCHWDRCRDGRTSLAGKSIQLIREMLPSARRVTALANATDPFSNPFLEQIQLGGEATGTAITALATRENVEVSHMEPKWLVWARELQAMAWP
jgi:putative ABC transport system substrate-binding protein